MGSDRSIFMAQVISSGTLPPRLEPKDESYSMYKSMLEVMVAWAGAPRFFSGARPVTFLEDWWCVRGGFGRCVDGCQGNPLNEGFRGKIIEVKGKPGIVRCIPLLCLITRGCVQSILLTVHTLKRTGPYLEVLKNHTTKFLPSGKVAGVYEGCVDSMEVIRSLDKH